MFSERGLVMQDMGHVLIYKSHLLDIPVKIIYSFDDKKRLRSAGYIVDKPVGGVSHLKDYALKLHGEPTNWSSSQGIGWVTSDSMIYLQLNERVKVLSPNISAGGPLSHLADQNEGAKTLYWDGVWGYLDLAFLDNLYSVRQLNYYEKLLLGVMRARTSFILGGEEIKEVQQSEIR